MKRRSVPGTTKAQRKWILQRDENQCMMRTFDGELWVRCTGQSPLEVHHILPRGFASIHAARTFAVNGPDNLITLCRKCHKKVHPDMVAAQFGYAESVDSYNEVFETRNEMTDEGRPYWRTRWDWMFHFLTARANTGYEPTYPESKHVTLEPWREAEDAKKVAR